MSDRLGRALEAAGVEEPVRAAAVAAFRDAVRCRLPGVPDPDDPRFLHPGRTLLILLEDEGEGRQVPVHPPGELAPVLAASPLLESVEPWLNRELGEVGSPDVRSLLEGLPRLPQGLGGVAHGDEEAHWVEALVLAEPRLQRLVLAEALDHLRHLHLPSPVLTPSMRKRILGRVERVLLPLSRRAGGSLERRVSWWWQRVGLRLREREEARLSGDAEGS